MGKNRIKEILNEKGFDIKYECDLIEKELNEFTTCFNYGARLTIYNHLLNNYINFPLKNNTIDLKDLITIVKNTVKNDTEGKYLAYCEVFLNAVIFTLTKGTFKTEKEFDITEQYFKVYRDRIKHTLNKLNYVIKVIKDDNQDIVVIVKKSVDIDVLSKDIPTSINNLILDFRNHTRSPDEKIDLLTKLYNHISSKDIKKTLKSMHYSGNIAYGIFAYFINCNGEKHKDKTQINLVKLIQEKPTLLDDLLLLFIHLYNLPNIVQTIQMLEQTKTTNLVKSPSLSKNK